MRNASFRNYADYMAAPEFRAAAEEVLEAARRKPTALMCAEGLYWRCHRRLVSDYLVGQGAQVRHILPSGDVRPHELTPGARFDGGELTYPPPARPGPTDLLFE